MVSVRGRQQRLAERRGRSFPVAAAAADATQRVPEPVQLATAAPATVHVDVRPLIRCRNALFLSEVLASCLIPTYIFMIYIFICSFNYQNQGFV